MRQETVKYTYGNGTAETRIRLCAENHYTVFALIVGQRLTMPRRELYEIPKKACCDRSRPVDW